MKLCSPFTWVPTLASRLFSVEGGKPLVILTEAVSEGSCVGCKRRRFDNDEGEGEGDGNGDDNINDGSTRIMTACVGGDY